MRVALLIAAGFVAAVAGATLVGGSADGVSTAQTPTYPVPTTTAEPPANELPPGVSGRLRDGETVLLSPGRWSGTEPLRFENRWERCDGQRCRPVAGDGFQYRLGPPDVGNRMRGVVTASNQAGTRVAFGVQSPLVKPKLRPIEPFPVVAIRGYITRFGTLVTRLAARAPAGSTLRVRCRGRGCPYRRAGVRLRRHFVAVRSMHRRTMRARAIIELRVTNGDTIGKYTRFRFRRGRRPARVDRCLSPDERAPIRCPRLRR